MLPSARSAGAWGFSKPLGPGTMRAMLDARRSGLLLWLAACVTFAPVTAFAGEPAAPPLAGDRAVEYANQGLEHYAARRWEEAYEAFRMADGIVPSPLFQLYMARARREQQRLIEARALYRKVIAAEVAETAPPTFKQAQVDALAELAGVEDGVASIVVSVEGAADAISLTIDGRPAAPGEMVEVDPGERVITARSGSKEATLRQVVHPGDKNVAVVVRFDSASASASASVPGSVPEPSGSVDLAPWGWALGAVGAASAIVGAVLGGVALSQDASITDRCTPACPEAERAELESDQSTMLTLADASTGTLIAGGVLLAAGVTLLVVDAVVVPDGAEVQASIGPTGAGLRVRF